MSLLQHSQVCFQKEKLVIALGVDPLSLPIKEGLMLLFMQGMTVIKNE
jgi:hypothetical protein